MSILGDYVLCGTKAICTFTGQKSIFYTLTSNFIKSETNQQQSQTKRHPLESHVQPSCSVTMVMSNSLQPRGLEPTRLLCPWSSPGKNIGVGCHFLFQGIYLTQGVQEQVGSNFSSNHLEEFLFILGHKLLSQLQEKKDLARPLCFFQPFGIQKDRVYVQCQSSPRDTVQ